MANLPALPSIFPGGVHAPTVFSPSTGVTPIAPTPNPPKFNDNTPGIDPLSRVFNNDGSGTLNPEIASNILDIPKAIEQAGAYLESAVISFWIYGIFVILFVVLVTVFLTDKNPQELIINAGKTATSNGKTAAAIASVIGE